MPFKGIFYKIIYSNNTTKWTSILYRKNIESLVEKDLWVLMGTKLYISQQCVLVAEMVSWYPVISWAVLG